MLDLNSWFRAHPLALVIYVSLGTVIGSAITSYITSQSVKQEAIIRSQPEILRLATETLERVNADLNSRIVKLEGQLVALISENESLRNRVAELEVQIVQKIDQIKTLESFPEYMPGPAWMKNKASRMLLINSAYEREWGVTKWQYVGKLDSDIWPEEIAAKFQKHDQDVINCGCSIRTYELVPKFALQPISEKNPAKRWEVWKWPVIKDGNIFGIAGAAFEAD